MLKVIFLCICFVAEAAVNKLGGWGDAQGHKRRHIWQGVRKAVAHMSVLHSHKNTTASSCPWSHPHYV